MPENILKQTQLLFLRMTPYDVDHSYISTSIFFNIQNRITPTYTINVHTYKHHLHSTNLTVNRLYSG